MRPTVILADDHLMVADGLGRLIGEVADLLAKVSDGQQLVESVLRLAPDIVVSDITMPVMDGFAALRELKAQRSRSKFIFLTVHADARMAAKAIRAGARGYLLKAAAGEELFEAIRVVMAGRVYLTPHVAQHALLEEVAPQAALTARQMDVLQRIAEGKRMKEIAEELSLSIRTVEDHKAQLMRMLDARTSADLVRLAARQNLLSE